MTVTTDVFELAAPPPGWTLASPGRSLGWRRLGGAG